MKNPILTSLVLAGVCLSASLPAQYVYETATVGVTRTYHTTDHEGIAHASQTIPVWGFQTPSAHGNSISMTAFKHTMAAAHADGTGGVLDLANPVFAGVHSDDGSEPATFAKTLVGNYGGGSISITDGPLHYAEGGPYIGKETFPVSDFQGPSPAVAAKRTLDIDNGRITNSTSYDLVFDAADKITIVGFNYHNYNNFQSYQRAYSDVPNIRVTATFSGGSERRSAGFTQQVSSGNDYFFGFVAPDGEYLTGLSYYTVGNNFRSWTSMSNLGFAIDGTVVVPEASTLGLLTLGLGGLAVALRRRR